MLSIEQIDLVVENTYAFGGDTVDTNGRPPTEGYMVGGVSGSYVYRIPDAVDAMQQSKVRRAVINIATLMDSMSGENLYLGTWIDSKGSAVVEISQNILDYDEAVAVAIERGEEAIYDVEADESLYPPI